MPGDIATSVPERWYGYWLAALVGKHDVVRGPDRVEAEALGRLGDGQQHLLAVIEPDVRKRDPDAHAAPYSAAGSASAAARASAGREAETAGGRAAGSYAQPSGGRRADSSTV